MKRAVLSGAALLAAFVLPGCPVYPEDRGCFSHDDCPSGALCDSTGYCVIPSANSTGGRGGSSSVGQCDSPSDCRANETCGSDARCRTGSCSFHGCVSGFSCDRVDGVWACVRNSGTGGSAGSGGNGGSAGDGGLRPDSGLSGSDAGGSGGDGGGDATADGITPDGDVDANGSSDSASDVATD